MIGVKCISWSFDSKAILAAVDKAERTVLKIFGFNVRKEAMGSIKNAPPGVAAPRGSPPYSHMAHRAVRENKRLKAAGRPRRRGRGFPGLKLIQYYVEGSRSVMIGVASDRPRHITIAEALEYGKMNVSPHPFMGPAFQRTLPQLPAMWAGSVKR